MPWLPGHKLKRILAGSDCAGLIGETNISGPPSPTTTGSREGRRPSQRSGAAVVLAQPRCGFPGPVVRQMALRGRRRPWCPTDILVGAIASPGSTSPSCELTVLWQLLACRTEDRLWSLARSERRSSRHPRRGEGGVPGGVGAAASAIGVRTLSRDSIFGLAASVGRAWGGRVCAWDAAR